MLGRQMQKNEVTIIMAQLLHIWFSQQRNSG